MRETVREIVVPRYVEQAADSTSGSSAAFRRSVTSPAQEDTGRAKAVPKPLFTDTPDWVFLSYGVPPEWMDGVRAATEETLFDVAEHLPHEAAEALLNFATGAPLPPLPLDLPPQADPFTHPDAQRRFRAIESREELEHSKARLKKVDAAAKTILERLNAEIAEVNQKEAPHATE